MSRTKRPSRTNPRNRPTGEKASITKGMLAGVPESEWQERLEGLEPPNHSRHDAESFQFKGAQEPRFDKGGNIRFFRRFRGEKPLVLGPAGARKVRGPV